MTRVVNLRREQYDVYIGRAGKGEDGYFGNPYLVTPFQSRELAIEKYKAYFYIRLRTDPEFKRRVLELKDKTLGCFCSPLACHGSIIVDFLENQSIIV
jgi:hypothetical protein